MMLWSYMTAPKPDINVFFKQKTVHLTNGVQDPFQVLGPISNPILDIGGGSPSSMGKMSGLRSQHLWFVMC